jgi:hypothetical protein
MVKALLALVIVLALALALYTNVGDAQVIASWGACSTIISASAPQGARFCESLQTGHILWAVVFYASLAIAGLAAIALYILRTRKS